ncbi:class I SAM-dependent methyltransferase [Falsiroseomonas selenitidurans]|uniref:Class I SAM-dependent methyltransferase n=1 Tax=Falsiroseomonas selenitidurans TaxID=2716335 RepID=A0ABX1E6Y6_9PROT|nr:methyltransferase domain-containing protein [Falsiroseomonas selenitidurans]NKC32949.1 class I SAM-dependent methyltransferase [Falsiroseomonas selenitidurans]
MTVEVHALLAFYASPGGAVAARLVRDRLAVLWPLLPGQSVLGIGHAAPYLGLWQREAARCIALTPSQGGTAQAAPWPPAAPGAPPPRSAALLAEEDTLPFADASFDRVLLVHGLEAAENARRLLREAWRVLRDDGRIIVVVPNRLGLWAQLERTPFGHGQPYSAGQIARLLARHLFMAERREAALFLPPLGLRFLAATAAPCERLGRALCPRLAGVAIVEARKDLLAAVPAGAPALRRRMVLPA